MALYKLQVSMGADDSFARSKIINTIHLNDHGPTSDPEGLAQDVLDLYQTVFLSPQLREMKVTVYNVGLPPQLPIAQVIENENVNPITVGNRELALCLSYYNARSDPRKRGRLYMPVALTGQTIASARPSATIMNRCLDLGDGLAAIGGIDVDWVVYSPTTKESHNVVGTWCDDAWDVVRSRGLEATSRIERTPGP